jgi:hypothetical protein
MEGIGEMGCRPKVEIFKSMRRNFLRRGVTGKVEIMRRGESSIGETIEGDCLGLLFRRINLSGVDNILKVVDNFVCKE